MILETHEQLRNEPHVEGVFFRCGVCGQVKPVQTSCGTGYGYDSYGDDAKPVCYSCCAEQDKQWMVEHGRIALYLTCEPASKARTPSGRKTAGEVTNWPGTLRFKCHTRYGRHNIAGVRYDVWFNGPDGYEWHGVTYGNYTQVCHCRRTKRCA